MFNIDKQNIKENLNRNLEQENIKNIKKKIASEEDISHKLVKFLINQHDKKVLLYEKRLSDSLGKVSQKENTIYKNNIIIEKLNHMTYDQKKKVKLSNEYIEGLNRELVDINNKYYIEKANLQEIIEKKNIVISSEEIKNTNIKNTTEKIVTQNKNLKIIILKNNEEIYIIYKYSIYILLLSQIYNYIDIYPLTLVTTTAITGYGMVFIKFRFSIQKFLQFFKKNIL